MINCVVLSGRVVRDFSSQNINEKGDIYAYSSLAVDKPWYGKDAGKPKPEPLWFDIKCFGKLANTAMERLKKGMGITVQGKIDIYENKDKKKFYSIVCNTVDIWDWRDEGEKREQANNTEQSDTSIPEGFEGISF